MDEAAKESGGSQVISQLRKNQNIEYRGRIRSVESYFNSINKGIDQIIRVRDGKEINRRAMLPHEIPGLLSP
ncbi:hypothetical protein [Bathymodiolus japonicus methanotrophic gill symbiont]|uniref:hypothetical protein n=1 Tax=Bathymodiolus japonicus methanotrophic gill symbiont TaxID=113269 RepID=UPI001C8E08D8|nr:hypothetical protein [Bathymodiolus japonicus methanotrophic gill symbiont]